LSSQDPVHWEQGAEHEATDFAGSRRHVAAVDLDALADPEEPMPVIVAGDGTTTVVADLNPELAGVVLDLDVGTPGMSVLEYVGKALLQDP